jgi:F-type H+-transporting ATPase subunit epsilon
MGPSIQQEKQTMSASFQCTIMTPSGPIFEGEVTYVSFPAWDGQYGVMAGMAPMLGQLGDGPLTIEATDGRTELMLKGGFAHMQGGTLTLLTEQTDAA